jgi:uncharacterized protein (TIGR00369 family)
MSVEELREFMRSEFPRGIGTVEQAGDMRARVRLPIQEKYLRPGGTVSGPTMMALTDCAMFVALLTEIGPVALAVTTSLNINFLRKPGLADMIAEARLLKLGQRLAVGEITLYSLDQPEPVAHATCTYSIPRDRP